MLSLFKEYFEQYIVNLKIKFRFENNIQKSEKDCRTIMKNKLELIVIFIYKFTF